jgi:Tocopherol cyclase
MLFLDLPYHSYQSSYLKLYGFHVHDCEKAITGMKSECSMSHVLRRLLPCFLVCTSVVFSLVQDHRGVRPRSRNVVEPLNDPILPNANNKNGEARRVLQSPHSGRHFFPSHPAYRQRMFRQRRRFTEGWYYRLTIPNVTSFAFIFSIEDPGCRNSDLRLSCAQVIGPNSGYLVQGSRDDTAFWASRHEAAFGCTFATKANATASQTQKTRTELDADEWDQAVESGFQISPTSLKGRIDGKDGTVGDILDDSGERFKCEFDIAVQPIVGWGGTQPEEQKSTAGWLASFPVFEPHWQILLADARASGRVVWKNTTYHFQDVPFYAEKNWGTFVLQLTGDFERFDAHLVCQRRGATSKMVLDAMQFFSGIRTTQCRSWWWDQKTSLWQRRGLGHGIYPL